MTNYALRWLYVLQLPIGLWTPFLAISLARDGADVVCGHLMMRSFSLNENFALLAVEPEGKRDLEEGESEGTWNRVECKLCCRSQDEDGDTLIYWQDAR